MGCPHKDGDTNICMQMHRISNKDMFKGAVVGDLAW